MKLQTLIIILHLIYLIRHNLHQRNRQSSTRTLITRRTLVVSQIQLLHQSRNPTYTICVIHRRITITHVLNSSRYRRKASRIRPATAELRLNISTKTSIRDRTRFSTEKLYSTSLPSHGSGKHYSHYSSPLRAPRGGGLRPLRPPLLISSPGARMAIELRWSQAPGRSSGWKHTNLYSILGEAGNTGNRPPSTSFYTTLDRFLSLYIGRPACTG